jgi:peptidyl-prolyl cis-trans isomerase D
MAAKTGNRYFLWFILILLFVGLIGFGTGGLTGNVRSLGTVGEKEIDVQDYAMALRRQIQAFGEQIGTPLTFQQAQAIGLDQQVLAGLVAQRTLDNEVGNLGLSVGDERVLAQIVSIPGFQALDGTFDRETYRRALEQNGLTEAEFEAGLREDTTRKLLQGAIVGGIPEPAAFADAVVQYIGERRAVTWATLSSSALTTPLPAPTDADLQAQYDASPANYTTAEVRKITYVWLTPEMIQDAVTVDEQALRDLYQERINDYVQPERRLVERLVFGTEEEAAAARARLDAGEIDFDTLVTERGLDLADVDLGDVGKDQLGLAGDAVFAAEAGGVTGPFMSDLGPALFRMNAVLAAVETTFEQAKPDLRDELANQRARRIIADAGEGIIDLLAGGATLEDVAQNTDMELGTIDWSEGQTDGIAAYDSFRVAAQTVEQNAFPEVLDFDDGGIFALRLDSIVAPSLKPIDEVRDQVDADWTLAATQTALMAEAERQATAINSGASFEDQGLVPTVEPGLTRRDFVPETPQTFLTDVFKMEPGQTQAVANGDRAIIVRLDSVTPPDAIDPAMLAEGESVAQQAAGGIAEDIFTIFSQTLQTRTEVSVNQAAVNAVHAQFQ